MAAGIAFNTLKILANLGNIVLQAEIIVFQIGKGVMVHLQKGIAPGHKATARRTKQIIGLHIQRHGLPKNHIGCSGAGLHIKPFGHKFLDL